MPRKPPKPPVTVVPVLPSKYHARSYQRPVWQYMATGGYAKKRAVLVWHRRSGKDTTALNVVIHAAALDRVGAYYYFFPKYTQAKKVIWQGRNREGMKFLDHIPAALIAHVHETDMRVTIPNGSSLQLIGTDNWDGVMGTNPVGCVFSEFALQDPRAWDYVRPILRENGGWAVFIYTPRGKNHGYRLFRMAEAQAGWFAQKLTVDMTRRDAPGEDGNPVVSPEDIAAERAEGMDEELVQQEYYCSFEGGVQGAYYAALMRDVYSQGRVTSVPWDPQYPVVTAWDLGIGDKTAIWFAQFVGKEVRLIDYVEASGEALPYWAREVKNERRYLYDVHMLPHDAKARSPETGRSREDILYDLGVNPTVLVPKLAFDDGVQAVRQLLPRCVFDAVKCERGLDALSNHRKEWDDEVRVFRKTALHDWTSDGADAFRTLSVGVEYASPPREPKRQEFAETDFDVFANA